MPAPFASIERHLGLDWLRIAAFALLIVYHVAMVFAPWPWVVKWPQTQDALIVPMALLTPWRLPLLFAVSGFATRRMLARHPSLPRFAHDRSVRLLAPLAFGMFFLLPPELWVRAREAGDPLTLGAYWTGEYWSGRPAFGAAFPAWEHLWFVVYLWAYTVVLAGVLAWRGTAPFDQVAAWLAEARRLLWVPAAALVTVKIALLFVVAERHWLLADWSGHAEYLPLFAFGFALGGTDRLWRAVHAQAGPAAALAIMCGGVAASIELAYPGNRLPPHIIMAAERAAQVTMAWSATLALLALADRHLRSDHRWRARLAEAVFPAYLIHHPVIVMTTWALLPWRLPAPIGFALILFATAAACAGFYLLAREVAWLRPLAGLTPVRAHPPRAAARIVPPA